ncbi:MULTISPECIES: ATP-grasp fold amidoligase family protein [unclassified Virgibacillus]|uniref:ATP-grasp fold amidoligase family protein n=1 Tax=Virgibacillus TaxID=84406 RepID=UPI000A7AA696|nr:MULTISPECIES: ATP-grasp fold amidoligase family protein [unclassified Virgibacillus]MBS7428501.1 glycosyl transferase [Virgibacillus sp. 19R1-5]
MKSYIKRSNLVLLIYRKTIRFIHSFLSIISPKFSTKVLYKKYFGKKLNLDNPKTLNEKIQWLKLNTYNNNHLVTQCADKYQVRKYVESLECGDILNDLIGVWDNINEIDWEKLPNKFALKVNHGCGYNIICKDKKQLDIKKTEKQIKNWLKEDFWKLRAEINYKYIPKKIICERYIETHTGELPEDFKIYCFNGVPEFIMLCVGREEGKPKFYYFDKFWNIMPYTKDALENPDVKIIKPNGIDQMLVYAEKLSQPFPFVRADFYLDNGKVIFGELTFTPSAGLDTGRLPETDRVLGDLLKLPN